MQVINKISDLRQQLRLARQEGSSIGYVPTMGYLHEGHLSLVQEAQKHHKLVVVSIFVNPLQFGPNEDFDQYPRDLDRDSQLLAEGGCDILFAPSVDEMYPQPMQTEVRLPAMSTMLCGRSRPTHFQGVATVVCKLLNIVQPDAVYFGQKDAQQVAIIRRMVADLSIPVDVISVSTVREASGLAKSSRNLYLTDAQRETATVLYQALQKAVLAVENGERNADKLAKQMKALIETNPSVRLDYAEVVNLDTLQPIEQAEGRVLFAVAAYVGKARLIDNIPIEITGSSVRKLA